MTNPMSDASLSAPRPFPPGGAGLPLIGHGLHLVEIGKRPDTAKAPLFKLLEDMRAEHGPVFRLRVPGIGTVVYLEDPVLVREVYRLHGVHVESSFPDSLVKIFGAAVTGEPHRAMRQTFNALVRKTLEEEERFETMQQMVREEMLTWCDAAGKVEGKHAAGRTLLDDRATRIALRVAAFGFLGERYAFDRALCDRLIELYAEIENGVFSLFPYALPGTRVWKALRARAGVEEILRGVLRDYAARGIRDAYIHQIYDVGVKSYYSPGCGLTQEECALRSIVGLLFASFDTTRVALMTAMAAMTTQPDFVARLRGEIAEAGLLDGTTPLTNASLNALELLDCFVWEVLRINPVTQLGPRIAIEDFDLGPYRIQKGWNIWIPVKALCASPTLFRDPELFNPARFLEDERENLEIVSWIFAAGKRVCPGRRLVLAEVKLMCFFLMTLMDVRNRHPASGGRTLSFRSDIPFNVIRGFDPVFTLRDPGAGRSPTATERHAAIAKEAAGCPVDGSGSALDTQQAGCPHAGGPRQTQEP